MPRLGPCSWSQSIDHIGLIATGTNIPQTTARFLALDSDGDVFDRFRYDIETVHLESVQLETNGTSLSETFGMNFGNVTWTAQDDAEDAKITKSFDVASSTSE